MDKKAVSGVVVTVLMVLLIVGLITILWTVISGFVKSNIDVVSTGINMINIKVVENSLKYKSIDSGGGELSAKIKRETGQGELSKIRFIIENEDGNSFTKDISTSLEQSETKIIKVTLTAEDLVKIGKITKLTAHPITTANKKDSVGQASNQVGITEGFIDGLVAYWCFDDGTAKDCYGNYDGTINGNPVFTDGKEGNGKAMQFDGDDDYITTALKENLISNGDFTVLFWIKNGGDYATSTYPKIIYGQTIQIRKDSQTDLNVRFGYIPPLSPYVSKYPVPMGEWHYIAAIGKNIDATASIIKLYFDANTPAQKDVVNTIAFTDKPIKIGGAYVGSLTNNNFEGELDEIRIYNRELSQWEINYLMNK